MSNIWFHVDHSVIIAYILETRRLKRFCRKILLLHYFRFYEPCSMLKYSNPRCYCDLLCDRRYRKCFVCRSSNERYPRRRTPWCERTRRPWSDTWKPVMTRRAGPTSARRSPSTTSASPRTWVSARRPLRTPPPPALACDLPACCRRGDAGGGYGGPGVRTLAVAHVCAGERGRGAAPARGARAPAAAAPAVRHQLLARTDVRGLRPGAPRVRRAGLHNARVRARCWTARVRRGGVDCHRQHQR